jgi:hypothetical protein
MLTSELNRLWPSSVYLVKPRRMPEAGRSRKDSLMLGRAVLALLASI